MAKEAIDAIRRAELQAGVIEKAAQQQKEAELREALDQARRIREEQAKLQREAGGQAVKAAKEAGERMMKSAVVETEREIAALRQAAQQKREAAVAAVLQSLAE